MINLLPPDTKQSYRYAARNVSLLRWVMAAGLGIVLVAGVGAYGWLSIRQSIASSNKQATAIQTNLKQARLTDMNHRIIAINNSFKLSQKVLSQEILFSKLLKQMATALPNGTYLSGLNIADVSGGSGLDVTVNAANYDDATQVQLNLSDPTNQIFAKADIQNVTCDDANASRAGYPCTITLRAQFAPNNQFLFINQKQAKS